MSALSLLSSLKEKTSDDSQKNGSSHDGHDESEPGAGLGDPAVLALGPARRVLCYSIEQLLRLRDSPLVRQDLDQALARNDALALVLKRRSDSPNEDDRGARGDAPNDNHKGVYGRERRSADPRERVRKESEGAGGIVLSPQRRSFTSGCQAPAPAAPAPAPPPHVARTRPESPLSVPPASAANAKPEPAGRRIGSGRIMVRDGGSWEEGEVRAGAEPYRPPRERERDRERESHARSNGDRFERRSYGRDSYTSDMKRERDDRFNNEKNRDRDDNRRSGGRYNNRRYNNDEEPEWFSGGPTSQHETIELRGFDDPKKTKETHGKDQEKWNGGSRSPERWRSEPAPSPPAADTTTTASAAAANADTASTNANAANTNSNTVNNSAPEVTPATQEPERGATRPEQGEFNLDEFLQMDAIPDVLTNGGGESEGGGSRFSRWFHRDSPPPEGRQLERLLHNIVDELEPAPNARAPQSAPPPSEPSHVFTPISPPHPHSHPHSQPHHQPHNLNHHQQQQQPPAAMPSLLDLLRRANASADRRESSAVSGGKVHSLEELEARLRPQPPPPPPDHDMAAFKRLLAQVSGGHAVPAEQRAPPPPPPPQPQPQPQPMSLLQMLSKSMEQQQHQPKPPAPPHIPQELLYKLLEVQQRQQHHHQTGPMEHAAPPPAAPPGPSQADRELLQRPEAQAIIHGLKGGEITVQHLMQQLGNPGLQSRHREVLLTILRLHHQRQQMGESPLPNAAPHLVLPPHHQPLRLSPLPHPAYSVSPIMATSPNTLTVHHPGIPARIPSPRELSAHTQSIMQSALIKKKLEEQRENYRRRHDLPKQPTPISFTPTSVLRKMTAEKEAEAPSPKQQWAQPAKMPQGRPIVKGNQAGAAPMGYAPQSEYQQYLAQQQQLSMGRGFSQAPQPRPLPYGAGGLPRGVPAGSTLHQLLMQSHSRTLSEMGAGAGGGDNQLARWFSPELLARASAGKLPSVHVPNALSLEDLERHHHSPAPPVRN